MAPELFTNKGYRGEAADIFALGVVLFAMMMGRPPFRMADLNDPYYRLICSSQFEEFWEPWDLFANRYGFAIPNDFKNLFISMVSYYPAMRLSISEVAMSPWVQGQTPESSEVYEYMSLLKYQLQFYSQQ